MENLHNDFSSPRRTLMCSEISCPCNATGGHLDGGRCRGCLDPETLANCCPRREREYVDCDTTVVDCEGIVMDKAVAFANINAFFTEGLATRESYW